MVNGQETELVRTTQGEKADLVRELALASSYLVSLASRAKKDLDAGKDVDHHGFIVAAYDPDEGRWRALVACGKKAAQEAPSAAATLLQFVTNIALGAQSELRQDEMDDFARHLLEQAVRWVAEQKQQQEERRHNGR